MNTAIRKWKWSLFSHVRLFVTPMEYTVHGILQARILEWIAFPFSRDLPTPGIEPRFPTLQVDSLPAEPQGKPKQRAGKKKIPFIFEKSKLCNSRMRCINFRKIFWDRYHIIGSMLPGSRLYSHEITLYSSFTIFSITRSNNYTTCYTCHELLFHKIFF